MELLNRRIIEGVIDTISRAPGVRVFGLTTLFSAPAGGRIWILRRLGRKPCCQTPFAVGEMIRPTMTSLLLHVEADRWYTMEVSYGVSSSKNIIPMFLRKIPEDNWLIRFVIGLRANFGSYREQTEQKEPGPRTRSVNKAGVLRSESAAGKKTNESTAVQSSLVRIRRMWSVGCLRHSRLSFVGTPISTKQFRIAVD